MNPRLRRLQTDYDSIRNVYSGHPHIRIEPTGATLPPETYRIVYRLRGLTLEGDRPVYRDQHVVDLQLPLKYPAEKPYAVPVDPIFHPNIREYFCIADHWSAGTPLTDIVAKIGDMIQWRVYNPASPLDAIAAKWAIENEGSGFIPVGNVDLGVADFDISLGSGSAEPQPAGNGQEPPKVPLAAVDASGDAADATPDAGGDDDFVILLNR